MGLAKPIERFPPLDAKLGFERIGRVVDAGMDDTTVVGAGFRAWAGVALEQTHGTSRARGRTRTC